MKLLVNVLHTRQQDHESMVCRCAKGLALLLSCVTFVVIFSLFISGYCMNGSGIIYAVDQSNTTGYVNAQNGLLGVIHGVGSMKEYDYAGQTKVLVNANEEMLVGTKAVKRSRLNRDAFSDGLQRAGVIGEYALEKIADNQISYQDYYTLLQIVEAEATGGDIPSKLLIANVVLNRVNDSHFPDTIYDVVWERVEGSPQFSPTADGRIETCTITDSTVQAVDLALQGEDNSQGALFFIARASASQVNIDWFDSSLVQLFSYGGHDFFTFKEYCE